LLLRPNKLTTNSNTNRPSSAGGRLAVEASAVLGLISSAGIHSNVFLLFYYAVVVNALTDTQYRHDSSYHPTGYYVPVCLHLLGELHYGQLGVGEWLCFISPNLS